MTAERFGPYELCSLLGRGGMGEVYRAVDTRKNRGAVALKRLPGGLADDVDFHRRFLREAELAARLREPHVIPIHDYGQIDGQPYLEMRLVEGVDLATHLRRRGRLAPDRAVHLVDQIAAALDAAHDDGLVHRDVKPGNILFDRADVETADARSPSDFVYLIDFGIAANLLTSHRSSSLVSGTVAYMAPERFGSGGDHRVDVYALGCVLFELLTGRPPFSGDHLQLMGSHIHGTPPPPSAFAPHLPAGFDDVVGRAMAKEPDDRPATAGALAAAARRALAGGPVPARRPLGERSAPRPTPPPTLPVDGPARGRQPRRRSRGDRLWEVVPVVALGVVGLALVVIVLFVVATTGG